VNYEESNLSAEEIRDNGRALLVPGTKERKEISGLSHDGGFHGYAAV
jgi:hypothetical protein